MVVDSQGDNKAPGGDAGAEEQDPEKSEYEGDLVMLRTFSFSVFGCDKRDKCVKISSQLNCVSKDCTLVLRDY